MHHFSAIISRVQKSLYKTECLARGQHVFSLSHWAHYFLAIFRKVQEFGAKRPFSPRSGRFVIFALAHHFLAIFSKVHDFVQNRSFHPEISTFCNFRTGRNTYLAVFRKAYEFLQNSVFSPRSACFVIFALIALIFSAFEDNVRVCTKKKFSA